MSLENAFETGRLYKPLKDIADARRDIYSAAKLLPGLRGFWPMSANNESGAATDQSGLNQPLTINGTPTYNLASMPYIQLNGSTDYLSHFDTAIYDIVGTESYIDPSLRGLTVGGWFRPDIAPTSNQGLITKHTSTGDQRSYLLYAAALTPAQYTFQVSSDGTAGPNSPDDGGILAEWAFVVGRFIPSTSVDVFVNGRKSTNSTSIPASLYNSSTPFMVGSFGGATQFDGRASLCFVCAAALPDSVLDNLYQTSRILFGV